MLSAVVGFGDELDAAVDEVAVEPSSDVDGRSADDEECVSDVEPNMKSTLTFEFIITLGGLLSTVLSVFLSSSSSCRIK